MTSDLTFLEEGEAEAEAVLLLNGWPTDSFVWRRLVPMLAARFRVLAPDLVSGDIQDQAAAVREFLEGLGVERYAAVGHSHGGAVAQLLALDGPAPEAMILLDTAAFGATPPAGLEPLEFIRGGSTEFDSLTAEEVARYLAAPIRPAPALKDVLEGREAEMASWELPVFLLWGEDDPYVPVAVAERLNEAIPGSALGVVPDSGHFLLDDAFDSIGVMMVEYLRSQYLRAPHGHAMMVPMRQGLQEGEQEVGPNA